MERTFSKAQLVTMNKDPMYGCNWILNIQNIGEQQKAILYPTGNASTNGKFYVAIPSTNVLTQSDKQKWNMF